MISRLIMMSFNTALKIGFDPHLWPRSQAIKAFFAKQFSIPWISAKAIFDFGQRQYTFEVYQTSLIKVTWNATLTRVKGIFDSRQICYIHVKGDVKWPVYIWAVCVKDSRPYLSFVLLWFVSKVFKANFSFHFLSTFSFRFLTIKLLYVIERLQALFWELPFNSLFPPSLHKLRHISIIFFLP